MPTYTLRSIDGTIAPDGSYRFDLPSPGYELAGHHRLIEVFLPNTAYPITPTNNTLTYTDNTQSRKVTIPPAYYTPSTLATTLQGLMNAATGSNYFMISADSVTSLLSFWGTGPFTLQFSQILPNTGSNSLPAILGFTNVDASSSIINSVQTLVGPYPMNIGWNMACYITYVQGASSIFNAYYSKTMCSSIVPVIAGENDVAVYLPPMDEPTIHFNGNSNLTVTIKDDSNQIMNFNGASWYLKFKKVDSVSVHPGHRH